MISKGGAKPAVSGRAVSAHCNFIPYWAQRLGKDELVARQLSKRGGTLYCKSAGDRVKISGSAVLYAIADIQIYQDGR
jgi:predicted PhzF superfamily epimerase YddE/YHI9